MLRKQSLQSQIVSFIVEYIENNSLTAGDRLPPQAQLAEMMGVSIVSLREAVKTLEAKGILEVANGKGIYVKTADKNYFSAQIELKKEKDSLLDLLHLRRVLEKEILTLLINRATDEEIAEIGKVTDILMRKYNAGLPQNEEDRLFHHLIYKHCHSSTMLSVISSIDSLMDKFQDFPLGLPSPFTETIPLHEELFNAIQARNVRLSHKINNQIIDSMIQDIKRA